MQLLAKFLSGFVFLGLLTFLNLTVLTTQAMARCDSRDSSVVKYSDCNSLNDCSNKLEIFFDNDMNAGIQRCKNAYPDACAEATYIIDNPQYNYTIFCIGKINQPTPTPFTCGLVNNPCCPPPLTPCTEANVNAEPQGDGSCICKGTPLRPSTVDPKDPFCTAEGHGGGAAEPQIRTAIGCIPVKNSQLFASWLLPILFSIIGGISFLLMAYGFITIAVSSGDPKKVQGARETITSAIIGLLISIFSLFILRLVAVNILHIPGL